MTLVEAIARAIDAGDQTTQTHLRNVVVYTTGLARAIGMSETDLRGLHMASLLHDIGKLAVPEHILSKPGPLTVDEFQKVRTHPRAGAEIVAGVPYLHSVAPVILSHHERWDGKGYPQGLRGEEIPLGARILTIADYFDAVTTERPYHKAMAREGAVSLIRHEAGRAFDPRLVEVFVEILPQLAAATKMPPSASTVAPASDVFDGIARLHRETYMLYDIAQALGTTLDIADTAAIITEKLTRLVPWSACALFMHEPQHDGLRCRYTSGPDVNRLTDALVKSGEGLAGWVAANRSALVNANPRVSFEVTGTPAHTDLKSAIVAPLLAGDELVGALALYHRDPDRYTTDHRRLLEHVASLTAPAFRNAVAFERVQEDSLTDPLTGLPNRRSMFMHLSRELARAGRLHGESVLVVMDIDNFKSINDTLGHHVGDEVLRAVAATLRSSLRRYDLCVRYAGDEFILVLADCPRESVDARCLELRHRVSDTDFDALLGYSLDLEISVGAAVFPHDGRTYEGLLEIADQRMYFEKVARRSPAVSQSFVDADDRTQPFGAAARLPARPTPDSQATA